MEEEELIFYIRALFIAFSFIWILIIALSKFYKSFMALILFIPLGYFLIGICNSEHIACNDVQEDVFKVTFISTGIILSMPLLTLVNDRIKNEDKGTEKEKEEKRIMINHSIFLALVFILCSYPHIWTSCKVRILFKVVRSCLETFGVTMYIFALANIFL